jgi:hypothetical protein
MYQNGFGTKQNYSKAFELFKKSALRGEDVAIFKVGYFYLNGYEVKQDFEEAFKISPQGIDIALNTLGLMYLSGKGVKKDYKKANEISNKNHIKLIEEQSKHLFLGNNSKLIDSSNKSNFLTISNNIKDRLDINLYFMTSLDNNISNALTNIQQQEALKEYYEYIKLHIDASKNEMVILCSLRLNLKDKTCL